MAGSDEELGRANGPFRHSLEDPLKKGLLCLMLSIVQCSLRAALQGLLPGGFTLRPGRAPVAPRQRSGDCGGQLQVIFNLCDPELHGSGWRASRSSDSPPPPPQTPPPTTLHPKSTGGVFGKSTPKIYSEVERLCFLRCHLGLGLSRQEFLIGLYHDGFV